MTQSKYRLAKLERQKKKDVGVALVLYKQGLSLREIGKVVGKSHEWVRLALRDKPVYKPVGKSDKMTLDTN